jgi:hypothetical protein
MARAEEAGCSTCEQLRPEGPDTHAFEVVPADGGGWSIWSAALLRLLQRVGHEPTLVVINGHHLEIATRPAWRPVSRVRRRGRLKPGE